MIIYKCNKCGSKKVSYMIPLEKEKLENVKDEVNYFCWECWGLTTLKIIDDKEES